MSLYKITFTGEILQGFEKESVKQNLMKLFGLNDDQAEKVLMKPGTTLKKQVNEENRAKYEAILAEAGIKTETVIISEPKLVNDLNINTQDVHTVADKVYRNKYAFSFIGDEKEYFVIWIRNLLLTFVTLGIYSAWAKVKKKQYFLKHTVVDNATFEYNADPITILKGRIVLAILLSLYFLTNRLNQPIALVVLSLFLLFLPWLIVRTLAFSAQSTSYSNIQFRFNATYREAAIVYLFWPLLAALSMGVLAPYTIIKQQKFVLEHTIFGSSSFRFNPKTHEFYWLVLRVLLLLLVGMGITMVFSILFSPTNLHSKLIFISFYIARMIPFLTILLIVTAYFSVSYSIFLFSAIDLSSLRFEANYNIKDYVKMFVLNGLAVLFTIGLYYPWAVVRFKKYKAQRTIIASSRELKSVIKSESTKPRPETNSQKGSFYNDLSL